MTSWKETPILQNGLIVRELAIGENGACSTRNLRCGRTGKEFSANAGGEPISHEFGVLWRNVWLHGFHPDLETQDFIFLRSSLRNETGGVQRLEIFLATTSGDLQVEVNYEIYEDIPLLRKWLTLTNSGKLPGRIDQVVWEDLAVRVANPSELEIASGMGSLQPNSRFTPAISEHLAILLDAKTRQGIVAVNEEPSLAAFLEVNSDEQSNLKFCYSKTFGGIVLEPNRTFKTAASAILFVDETSREHQISAVVPQYFRKVIPQPDSEPVIVYSTEAAVKADGKNLRLMPDAHFASSAGITTVCVEGGGFCRAGGFDIDPVVIPGGLGHAAKLLDERQMEIGISIPLAALDPECAAAQEHPEWLCRGKEGQVIGLEFGSQKRVMACLASAYGDYLLDEIGKLYERDNVRLVHLTGPGALASDDSLAPCHASDHKHAGATDAALAAGRQLASLLHDIKKHCPEMNVGLDYYVLGNYGGLDSSLFLPADFVRICQVPETDGRRTHLEARRELYRHALRFPSERLVMGSLRLDGNNPVATMATALGSFPFFTGSAGRLAPGQIDWMRGVLDWYFALSRGINFYERFYLLHNGGDARTMQWDGYARLSVRGEGFAAVFRNGAASSMERFPIPGLETSAKYRLDSIIRDRALGIFGGASLAEGFPFDLAHEDGADLIEIRRVET